MNTHIQRGSDNALAVGSFFKERSFHQGKIPPKVLKTIRTAEERGEVRRVHEDDIAGSLLIRRHPEQTVELGVTGCGEGMRTVEINRLARQQVHRFAVLLSNFIVRQVWMKVERRDICEQAELIKVPKLGKPRDLIRTLDACGTKPSLIVHRHVQSFHQRAGVLPEALLAWHEAVSVVAVFHLALI